jgi:hypothetical protein
MVTILSRRSVTLFIVIFPACDSNANQLSRTSDRVVVGKTCSMAEQVEMSVSRSTCIRHIPGSNLVRETLSSVHSVDHCTDSC